MNHRRIRNVCFALALACVVLAPGAAEHNPARKSPAADRTAATAQARVIVKFKADAALLRRHALAARAGAREVASVSQARATDLGQRVGLALSPGRTIGERAHVMMASGLSSSALAERLSREADVEYAVVDERRYPQMEPNDPLYTTGGVNGPAVGQWYLKVPQAAALTTGNEVVSSINAPAAWDITTGSATIVVADLDTGIRPEHPDLAGRTVQGYDFVSSQSNDSDDPTHTLVSNDGGGGDNDPSDPGDWIDATDQTKPVFSGCDISNSSWHGTSTASLIGAASNNGQGMAGVAWNVKLLPVRVLGKCFGYDSDIQAGMLWAAGLADSGAPHNTNPARVINMSLGGQGTCSASYQDVFSQLTSANVVVVVAAGNDEGLAVAAPANCPGAIAVGGLRHAGTKVGFSDVGPELTLSAPGGNCVNDTGACLFPIITATNTGTKQPVTTPAGQTYTDGLNRVSVGTSFSAPLVSGTVALMLSVNPALSNAQVKAALQGSARAFPFRNAPADSSGVAIAACHAPNGTVQDQCYCSTSTCGAGMLDAASAVSAALGLQPRIAVSDNPMADTTVTLDSSGTTLALGRVIVSRQWTLLDGGGIVTAFTSASNAQTATLHPTSPGLISVRLTITDDQGLSGSAETTLSVAASSVVVTPVTPTTPSTPAGSSAGGGGGGGGALSPVFALLLLAAAAAMWRTRTRRH